MPLTCTKEDAMLVRPINVFIATALVAASTLLPTGVFAAAQAGDGCPSDTSTPQQACYLGPDSLAVGALSFEGDQHFYRVEALDFGVELELDYSGAPYRLTIIDWSGSQIQSQTAPDRSGLTMVQTLGPPGSYYVLVDSPTRSFNPNDSYAIQRTLTYATPPIPSVLASGDFQPTTTDERDFGDSTIDFRGGSLHQHMAAGGTAAAPGEAALIFNEDFVTVTDFTLTVDAKLEGGSHAGYSVYFRILDSQNLYMLMVDSTLGKIKLLKKQNGKYSQLSDWVPTPKFAGAGIMNRTVIKATGTAIRVNINGVDVVTARDAAVAQGRIGFGTLSWAEAADFAFNDLLVTTPTSG
jgi:hypothetical protein